MICERPRICKHCLFYDGIPFFLEGNTIGAHRVKEFRINDNGICSVCTDYGESNEAAHREKSRSTLLESLRMKQGTPSVIAVSGGKDSLSSLYLARRVLGLDLVALFYDSGFILPGVIAQLRNVCRALAVPLREITTTKSAYQELQASVNEALPGDTPPCHHCSRHFLRSAAELAHELGTKHILVGANHFLEWPDDGPPTGISARRHGHRNIYLSALPYLFNVTRDQTLRHLAELGAIACDSTSGVSTNCQVPELVQRRLGESLGHVAELEMLSLEVLVGHLPRTTAAEEITAKARSAGTKKLQWLVEAFERDDA